jgi:hypothetical protein
MVEKKPNIAPNQMDKLEKQLDAYNEQVQALTLDRMNEAPLKEVEQQTKLSQKELNKKPDIYLKPINSVRSKEPFNELFRDEWNHLKEYVHFIYENYEVIGEQLDFWTKPLQGIAAERWFVPANKPVWGPRYVAEQISRCKYHRLKTVDAPTGPEQNGVTHYGTMVADTTINRLDAKPVRQSTNVFMGATAF